MKAFKEWLAERKRLKELRDQQKFLESECDAGRHDMNFKYADEVPDYFGRYRLCERRCGYSMENPSWDEAKVDLWAKKARAAKKAKQAAGALVCAVQGHDMEYLPPPDWMGWCKRCGWED